MSSKKPPASKKPPHKKSQPSQKASKPSISLEIQPKDFGVSGFSRPARGASMKGPPGGVYYEKAASRHRRHREVFRSSVKGQAVVEEAVPLGGGGKRSSERISLKRKALMDAAKKKAVRTSHYRSGHEDSAASAKRPGSTSGPRNSSPRDPAI